MRSATGGPISACLSTATICSTLNRFRVTASSFPFPGAIMPETLPQIGSKIGEPTTKGRPKTGTERKEREDMELMERSRTSILQRNLGKPLR